MTFEGIDGSGKTTALQAVAEALRAEGHKVLCTREPGGSDLGRTLRRILLDESSEIAPAAELFLFLADRAQHVAQVIRPALAEGHIVLCDRFTDSTLAYQGFARKLDLQMLDDLNRAATQGLEPDCTLLLDLPVANALQRLALRKDVAGSGEGRIDSETLDFHENVRRGFHFIAEHALSRVCLVDANLPGEAVCSACLAHIRERLAGV